jgi:hypothetical protein
MSPDKNFVCISFMPQYRYMFLSCHPFELITLIIFDEEHSLLSSLLCNLHSPLTLPLWGKSVLLNTLFFNNLNLFPLWLRETSSYTCVGGVLCTMDPVEVWVLRGRLVVPSHVNGMTLSGGPMSRSQQQNISWLHATIRPTLKHVLSDDTILQNVN